MSALFLQGNSRDVLKNLPADYFHCAMTSPPYFGLRRYSGGEEDWGDWKGALGNEPTPELYLRHLVEVCREVRRVLRPDGVFWLNIGDSWAGSGRGPTGHNGIGDQVNRQGFDSPKVNKFDGCKPLDMVLIPEQLALALRADGWWLRSILIWAKGVSLSDEYNGNPMPESVNGWRWTKHQIKVGDNGRGKEVWRQGANETPQQDHDKDGNFQNSVVWQDCPGCPKCSPNGGYVLRKGSWRPTDSYEHILMLAKTNSYYCDREAVLENYTYSDSRTERGLSRLPYNGKGNPDERNFSGGADWLGRGSNGGRNLRSVLAVPTRGFSGAHFAVYPPQLIEPLIKAATSEKGCCPKCGSPWARVIDKGFTAHDGDTATQYGDGSNANRLALLRQAARQRGGEYGYDSKYTPDATGLPQQGFQRDNSVEAERVVSREEAKSLFPDDERKQQDYINHIHDHGGLDKGRTIGWLPTCQCEVQETEPCRVLDMFAGAGTTALVSERLGLDSIGIDTSAEYIALAEARLAEDEQKWVDEQIKQLRREARLAKGAR